MSKTPKSDSIHLDDEIWSFEIRYDLMYDNARELELEVAELKKENKKLLDKISLLKTDYLVLDGEYFAKLDELERENAELERMLSNVIDT